MDSLLLFKDLFSYTLINRSSFSLKRHFNDQSIFLGNEFLNFEFITVHVETYIINEDMYINLFCKFTEYSNMLAEFFLNPIIKELATNSTYALIVFTRKICGYEWPYPKRGLLVCLFSFIHSFIHFPWLFVRTGWEWGSGVVRVLVGLVWFYFTWSLSWKML